MGRSDPQAILRRFEQGRRCFGLEIESSLVSFGWLTPGPEKTGELERVLSVPADEMYIWDCGTVPAHRRQGHYTTLLNRTLRLLHAEGAPRTWIGASRLNQPSIRGIAQAGFRHVIDLTYRRFGKLTWIVMRRAPGVPEHLLRASRAILLRPEELVIGPVAFGWRR